MYYKTLYYFDLPGTNVPDYMVYSLITNVKSFKNLGLSITVSHFYASLKYAGKAESYLS
jgi:hypothetical protein